MASCAACSGSAPTAADPATTTSLASAPQVRVVSVPVESSPVGPPASSPLALVRRDCGQSVPLPEGGAVWLWCDTTMFESTAVDADTSTDDGAPADGGRAAPRLRWFVNSSASVATDDDPLTMIDDLDRDERVRPVVTPHPDYPSCDPGEGRFTWPAAAVPVDAEVGVRDAASPLIAIWYGNVCVVPGNYLGGTLGVAVLDPPDGPPDPTAPERIEATILDDQVFGREPLGNPFGQAAVRAGDEVYVYRCGPADDACQVARAPARADAVAHAGSYEVWDGTGWSPYGRQGEAAVGMVMPGPVRGLKPSVEWLPELGVFVWADHLYADPGTVALRVAHQPWGPWSERVEVDLPGCAAFYPLICFAVEVHEQLSGPGEIGLTWYDPTFPAGEAVPSRFAAVGVEVGDG